LQQYIYIAIATIYIVIATIYIVIATIYIVIATLSALEQFLYIQDAM
jgi:hypothetical protein